MNNENNQIGNRIRIARKQNGLNQTELAALLDKSLRTIQKYESGEIEVSIAMINEIANKLNTTSTYLIGHSTDDKNLRCMADIMEFLFTLDNMEELAFSIDVKKPPMHDGWECSISFDGKNTDAAYNADICLFLAEFAAHREDFKNYMLSKDSMKQWKDKTLAYYSSTVLSEKNSEEIDTATQLKRRNALLSKKYGQDIQDDTSL